MALSGAIRPASGAEITRIVVASDNVSPRRSVRDELKDSPGAANQRLKALKALFAWACEDEPELAPQNPTLG
jgi:hypothetical protein